MTARPSFAGDILYFLSFVRLKIKAYGSLTLFSFLGMLLLMYPPSCSWKAVLTSTSNGFLSFMASLSPTASYFLDLLYIRLNFLRLKPFEQTKSLNNGICFF